MHMYTHSSVTRHYLYRFPTNNSQQPQAMQFGCYTEFILKKVFITLEQQFSSHLLSQERRLVLFEPVSSEKLQNLNSIARIGDVSFVMSILMALMVMGVTTCSCNALVTYIRRLSCKFNSRYSLDGLVNVDPKVIPHLLVVHTGHMFLVFFFSDSHPTIKQYMIVLMNENIKYYIQLHKM